MAVENRADYSNVPFIRHGIAITKDSETLLKDAGRSVPLVYGTLMTKVSASQKWVPFTDETATDGTAIPLGIYVGDDVTAAALVADDVVDAPVLVGQAVIDKNQLVIENSKTLATVITVGTTDIRNVEDHLANIGIFAEDTVDIDEFENA